MTHFPSHAATAIPSDKSSLMDHSVTGARRYWPIARSPGEISQILSKGLVGKKSSAILLAKVHPRELTCRVAKANGVQKRTALMDRVPQNALPDCYRDELDIIGNSLQSLTSNALSHHQWANSVTGRVGQAIERVRGAEELIGFLQQSYGCESVEAVPQIDELYFAVSPQQAAGSDRSLVDAHYDAPFGSILPGKLCRLILVLVACNDNPTVSTHFPEHDNLSVTLQRGDYVCWDYNRTLHYAQGAIPAGHRRVLLKLHYLVSASHATILTKTYTTSLNIWWTWTARAMMRYSSQPETPLQRLVALVVDRSRQLKLRLRRR